MRGRIGGRAFWAAPRPLAAPEGIDGGALSTLAQLHNDIARLCVLPRDGLRSGGACVEEADGVVCELAQEGVQHPRLPPGDRCSASVAGGGGGSSDDGVELCVEDIEVEEEGALGRGEHAGGVRQERGRRVGEEVEEQ